MPKDMRSQRKNGPQKDSGAIGFLYGKHKIKLNTVHKNGENVEIYTLRLLRENSGEYLYLALALKIDYNLLLYIVFYKMKDIIKFKN